MPLSFLQLWELEMTLDGSRAGCVLRLRLSSPTFSVGRSPAPLSCGRGGESALQSKMGAASRHNPGCRGRMDRGPLE